MHFRLEKIWYVQEIVLYAQYISCKKEKKKKVKVPTLTGGTFQTEKKNQKNCDRQYKHTNELC